MDVLTGLQELFVVALVSALAPLVAALVPRQRIPQVVLLLLGGMLIGPHGLGIDSTQELELVANVGLGFVFLLAGFEIDATLLVSRAGRLAAVAWVVALVAAIVSITAIAGIGLALAWAPKVLRGSRLHTLVAEGADTTGQTTVRWSILLLIALLVLAGEFGLDVVLGAFLAGVVLRHWTPGEAHAFEAKLDAMGYGFFIPVFFVVAGMAVDLHSILEAPVRVLVFLVL